ncbi:MAG: dihydropteroate synthase [Candidatus Thermoplasmatota archaeon]|nr:dihydropteroate synthase [Candidatus Thermoplasmatota archaeon]
MRRKKISISTDPLERAGFQPVKENFSDVETPVIVGILNVTPDSFSDGGTYGNLEQAVERAALMVREGAGIIDVGGESTRPFADPVPLEEEIRRTIPVVEKLVERIDVPVSIDTRHPEIALRALEKGACMVNDVNGLREDGMGELVAEFGASACIMHMKGSPKDMQIAPSYEDVLSDIHNFLHERVDSLGEIGIGKDMLMIDPGIGFGKRVGDNLMILRDLDRFLDIGCPVLIGASRKSFIGKVLDLEVDERLEGSIASAVAGYLNGASVFRIHDVKETRRALDLVKAVEEPEGHF